jgi:hypothetical protein
MSRLPRVGGDDLIAALDPDGLRVLRAPPSCTHSTVCCPCMRRTKSGQQAPVTMPLIRKLEAFVNARRFEEADNRAGPAVLAAAVSCGTRAAP